jgi:LiaI-LiaF-like transmembrane region
MASMTDPTPDPERSPDLGDRMKDLGREAQARGEQLGREAQAAGDRWAKDPSVLHAAQAASRVSGVIVLAAGVWFLADVTLGYSVPTIPWRDLWPALLVVIGLFIIVRGMTRRA